VDLANFNPELVPFIQLALAALFGMILGIERILAGSTAGPRTYGLVSMGSCLLTIMSLTAGPLYPTLSKADPIAIVSAVVTGVGFIGAGLIVFRGTKLSGLTTAAGIWVAAAIGIVVGFGFYLLAFFTTSLTLFMFSVMLQIENKIRKKFGQDLAAERKRSRNGRDLI
jgi:putative Mg2+ transporter-C (MgtC) family protein